MRGKDWANSYEQNYQGITPAYAGKSLINGRIGEIYRDHPRICGEKTKKIP